MRTYKNITSQDLSVVGVGIVKAGETVETDVIIESPNFELTSNEAVQPEAPAAQPQPQVQAPTQAVEQPAPVAVQQPAPVQVDTNQPEIKE